MTLTGTVRAAVVDGRQRDRRRRWLVTVDVERVEEGELAGDGTTLTLLVHSPSRDFADPDVVGHAFRLTLLDPVEDPYAGRFTAVAAGGD
ncbi:MAG TPA: hypothetical protein VKB57_26520 [Acidimicrobiales bacterium]|nr:hypothetical protein [Acidimicrobiales bacterium]